MAAAIIGNNVKVAVLGSALGAGACVGGVLLLVYNGRMLGTLTGLVWNGGYLAGFYSPILTPGVLELSAICVAAGGGFRLGWALVAPGRRPRRDAFKAALADAFGLLAGACLMLVVAGVIEAFVTPHFGATVRWSVAAGTGALMVAYLGLAGRGRRGGRGCPRPSSTRAGTSSCHRGRGVREGAGPSVRDGNYWTPAAGPQAATVRIPPGRPRLAGLASCCCL